MKKVYLITVFFIFVLAYFLRIYFLSQNSLTFGYDQARDAYISQQILKGDVKIQGPPASTPGLYHGVFYYYLLAPAYLVGQGNPIAVAYWIALLNASAVFIVFYVAYLLTKKVGMGLIAAFLFAISFEATQYATWLSNPTIGVWTVPLIYLGLWVWIQGRRWGAVVTAIGLGLSIQAEIFLAYHIVPITIWLWVSRKNISKRELIAFCLSLFAVLSTIILSQIKFGFTGISGLGQIASSQEASLAYAKSLGDYLTLYLNQIGRIFAFNSYPGNIGYGGIFVIILAIGGVLQSNKVVKFLSTWLFSHITVVTIGGTSTPFLMVGIGSAVSIIIAYYLHKWWETNHKIAAVVIFFIIIFGNFSMILRENPRGATLFAIQKDMLLSKEVALIDYTYQKSDGKPFSINSLTSPLWINIVWTYLYKWYGGPKYGYLPTWHGRDQVGQLDSLARVEKPEKLSFLILEPMGGIPAQYLDQTISEENAKSRVVAEKYFGELRVQERITNE